MRSRQLFWDRIVIATAVLGLVGLPATHWFLKHEREAKENRAYQARQLANMSDAEEALGRLKTAWLADESWEDELSAQGTFEAPYTMDVERALVKPRPFIFFGAVEDIHSADEHGNSLVSVIVHARRNSVRLRLSLISAPGTTAYLLNNESSRQDVIADFYKLSIFVATIDGVHKVTVTDKDGDDISYFLAHGTLHEAYATQVYADEFFR